MIRFGDHIQSIKPKIRVKASVTPTKEIPIANRVTEWLIGGCPRWQEPPKDSDMIIFCIYESSKKNFEHRFVIYFSKTYHRYWWDFISFEESQAHMGPFKTPQDCQVDIRGKYDIPSHEWTRKA